MKEHLKAKFPNIKDVDYALLPNAEEAKMEATDFFNVQWTAFNAGTGITKDKIIAAGIGSSSTQVYTMVNNEVVAIGDSTLGALPATGVVKDTMAKFGPKWGKLFPKSICRDSTGLHLAVRLFNDHYGRTEAQQTDRSVVGL